MTLDDSHPQQEVTPSEKKAYEKPTLKPYTRPKLRKHRSYKEITRLPTMPIVS